MKKRKHFILDHPVTAGILLTIWGILFYQLSSIAGAIVGSFAAAFSHSDVIETSYIYGYFFGAAAGIIALVIHRLWFLPEFRGCFSKTLFRSKDVLICFAVFAGIMLGSDIIGDLTEKTSFTLAGLGISLMAGICEEMAVRVLPVSVMMRDWMDEKHVPACLWISSLTFGLFHFINMTQGASFSDTLVQVIMATGLGAFLGSVYLRTGNILLCMTFHFLHDFLALLVEGSYDISGVIQELSVESVIMSLFVGIIGTVLGLYLTRKSVRDDIVSVWRERWKVSEIEASSDSPEVSA